MPSLPNGDVQDDEIDYGSMTVGEAIVAMYDNDTLPTLGDVARAIDEAIERMTMTEHAGLPVAGYQPQSDVKVALANEGKELEERYLRWLEKLGGHNAPEGSPVCDPRCIALAKTNIQDGAMWAIRSIFQPQRIKLPEDAA